MEVRDKIERFLEKLPKERQEEILQYVKYLLQKETEETSTPKTDIEWSWFSIEQAMRGMEDEEGPEYTDADLKVIY